MIARGATHHHCPDDANSPCTPPDLLLITIRASKPTLPLRFPSSINTVSTPCPADWHGSLEQRFRSLYDRWVEYGWPSVGRIIFDCVQIQTDRSPPSCWTNWRLRKYSICYLRLLEIVNNCILQRQGIFARRPLCGV